MEFPKVERSLVDNRWCVYTSYFESLTPWYLVPLVMLYVTIFERPPKKAKEK